jgi:hypothetical protein
VKAEQLDACGRTLTEVMGLLNNARLHKDGSVRKFGDRLKWAIKTKDQATRLLGELEQHKSAFVLAFSAEIW